MDYPFAKNKVEFNSMYPNSNLEIRIWGEIKNGDIASITEMEILIPNKDDHPTLISINNIKREFMVQGYD